MRMLLMSALIVVSLVPGAAAPAAAALCFEVPAVRDCIDGRFQEYWEQNGGLPVFGYPISPAQQQQTAEGVFLTQYFERARFELHPENARPYDVLLGRLGDDLLTQGGRDWRSLPRGRETQGCLWFAETEHSICDQENGIGFRTIWSSRGLRDPALDAFGQSLALFGLPLTEPALETNEAGHTVLTQWFERARFEYHPGNQPEFKVLLGRLGVEVDRPAPLPSSPPFDPSSFTLELTQPVPGFDQPLHATHAGDGSGRIFVVEKPGRIRVISGGALLPQPFLDITHRVGAAGSEQGLFAVAFHPRYEANGFFFVNYTNKAGDTVIARFHAEVGANQAEPGSASTILTVDQPFANHNGGQIAFGPDGYLYIGMGDGGGGGDPRGYAQNRESLLGKLLRLDVDTQTPYEIPRDNPFVSTPGARPEIWATGLRNPWRFSFDRENGDLFIGDVGQNDLEEIDWQPGASRGGENYGWNRMEGTQCFKPASGCDRSGLRLPIAEYGRELGCSITGGFRYRGENEPALRGAYLFGDFCSGRIWALTEAPTGGWSRTELLDTDVALSSFGEDEQGELYVTDLRKGIIYRLAAREK